MPRKWSQYNFNPHFPTANIFRNQATCTKMWTKYVFEPLLNINKTFGTYNAENTSYAIKLNILGNTQNLYIYNF